MLYKNCSWGVNKDEWEMRSKRFLISHIAMKMSEKLSSPLSQLRHYSFTFYVYMCILKKEEKWWNYSKKLREKKWWSQKFTKNTRYGIKARLLCEFMKKQQKLNTHKKKKDETCVSNFIFNWKKRENFFNRCLSSNNNNINNDTKAKL